jgi:aldehyde dehydrogenase (NAD+)
MVSVLPAPAKDEITPSVTRLLINGRWVPSESGKTFATVNPTAGEEICQVAKADAADMEKAVRAARAAFDQEPWRKATASERGRLLHRLTDLIETHSDELARLEIIGNGRPLTAAKTVDVAKTVACLPSFRRMG